MNQFSKANFSSSSSLTASFYSLLLQPPFPKFSFGPEEEFSKRKDKTNLSSCYAKMKLCTLAWKGREFKTSRQIIKSHDWLKKKSPWLNDWHLPIANITDFDLFIKFFFLDKSKLSVCFIRGSSGYIHWCCFRVSMGNQMVEGWQADCSNIQ